MNIFMNWKGEMMDDLISRQAAIDAVNDACFELRGVFGRCEDALKALPSAQPEIKTDENNHYKTGYDQGFVDACKMYEKKQPKRKTGHWIKTARWGRVYKCNRCGNFLDFDGVNVGRGSTNFCPNCGADMRGEQDG